jgi:hypothetical protein
MLSVLLRKAARWYDFDQLRHPFNFVRRQEICKRSIFPFPILGGKRTSARSVTRKTLGFLIAEVSVQAPTNRARNSLPK